MAESAGAYAEIYAALSDMREAFHSYGRIDDSNAKLDEVAKLFASYLAFRRGRISKFPQPDEPRIVEVLSAAFSEACVLPEYTTNEGISIFGEHPRLVLRESDAALAGELTRVVHRAVDSAFAMRSRAQAFDVLNEAFGHFIRDNFRSNIEDAQYMTPPEVVDFVVDLALTEIRKDMRKGRGPSSLTVMDPTCGVGSFLTTFSFRAEHDEELSGVPLRIVGQDKVERMVRLTSLNMALNEVSEHEVTIGNSLDIGSPLDKYNGLVDVIVTNPPFGARFSISEVKKRFGVNTPYFGAMGGSCGKVDSELLFIDRALALLKPGGRLFIVVPDGVISAKGLPALLRQFVQKHAILRGVVDLPSVTFAQAGTRTRTSVLYVQKRDDAAQDDGVAFMSVVDDLGFEVVSRKGVQIKTPSGENQLPKVWNALADVNLDAVTAEPEILSSMPSISIVPISMTVAESWTPSRFSAGRLGMLRALRSQGEVVLYSLGELVEFVGDERRVERYQPSVPYVSVLHVLGEGALDLKGVSAYAPKTPGLPLYPGELIFSRLNPHITRALVVPNLAKKMLCSNEFAIMKSRGEFDEFAVAYLIYSQMFLRQVANLTSGTSSSHNRIRTAQLSDIVLAIPEVGTAQREVFDQNVSEYRAACQRMMDAAVEVSRVRAAESQALGEINLIPSA